MSVFFVYKFREIMIYKFYNSIGIVGCYVIMYIKFCEWILNGLICFYELLFYFC